LVSQLTFLEASTTTVDALASSAPGAATALAPIAQPLSQAAQRVAADDPGDLTFAPKQILRRLWESLENSLAERGIKLDLFAGNDALSVFADVATSLRPDLKASNGLLRYVASVLRSRVPRLARARPGPAAPPGPPSPARAIAPMNVEPRTTGLPGLPSAAATELESPSGTGAALPTRSTSESQRPAETAAMLIVLAQMGLSRLADRRALRLSSRTSLLQAAAPEERFPHWARRRPPSPA